MNWSLELLEADRKRLTSHALEVDKNSESFDAVIILGRGIERLKENNTWVPCQYIQLVDAKGFRTGFREPDLEIDTTNTLVAGAEANIYAGIELFEQLTRNNLKPSLVIFAAGRPAYLEKEPAGFAEGNVLKEVFDKNITENYSSIINADTTNTKGDVVNSVTLCKEKGFKKVVLINTEMAMPRTKVFYEVWKQEQQDSGLEVIFKTSEEILIKRYSLDKNLAEKFAELQNNLKNSLAWKVTDEREKGGIEAIKSGSYKGTGKY